jgi:hypothetical protein
LGEASHWFDEADIEECSLVLLEDALNLADALDQAFLDYEPIRVPASFFLFDPANVALGRRPSVGAISEVRDFCRLGAFRIERYQRLAQ